MWWQAEMCWRRMWTRCCYNPQMVEFSWGGWLQTPPSPLPWQLDNGWHLEVHRVHCRPVTPALTTLLRLTTAVMSPDMEGNHAEPPGGEMVTLQLLQHVSVRKTRLQPNTASEHKKGKHYIWLVRRPNQQTWIQTTKSLKLCFIVFADKWLQKGSNKKVVSLKPVHRVHVLPLSPLWVLQLPVWMHICLSVLALQQHDSLPLTLWLLDRLQERQ